ncbi:hypothetical protein BpHYR1_029917 [Brachionus plicatilis]|uniref:Uncharacterized protein n=1 Tax=Brachionus plicatilis TaxID=10195 RepID=A0A3M7SVK3_BRAPC|nr:hypothetical protein BpHYR1_029917 [Brachionus plicatilis]
MYWIKKQGSNKKVTLKKPRPDNDRSGRPSRLVCGSDPSVPTVLHGRPNRPIRLTQPTRPTNLTGRPFRPSPPHRRILPYDPGVQYFIKFYL